MSVKVEQLKQKKKIDHFDDKITIVTTACIFSNFLLKAIASKPKVRAQHTILIM
jgi:hypothetical protein